MTEMTPEERQAFEDERLYKALFEGGPEPTVTLQGADGAPVDLSDLLPGATPTGETDPEEAIYRALFGA